MPLPVIMDVDTGVDDVLALQNAVASPICAPAPSSPLATPIRGFEGRFVERLRGLVEVRA